MKQSEPISMPNLVENTLILKLNVKRADSSIASLYYLMTKR